MHDGDPSVADTVVVIQGQEMGHVVPLHHRHKARIRDLHTRDRVGHDQALPLAVDRLTIWQPREGALNAPRPTVRLQRCEPIALVLGWTRGDMPALRHGLRRITAAGALHEQRPQAATHESKLGVVAFDETHQEVRVRQVAKGRHQSWS
jgi:hypothetical protein